MSLLARLRRRGDHPADDAAHDAGQSEPLPERLPDPSKPPTARGSWEHAALVNIAITEKVKREIGTVTPPWLK